MSLYNNNIVAVNTRNYNNKLFEQIIFYLADEFDIRFEWDINTAVISSVCALVGGVIGGYNWGKIGAAVGAGISGATALAACTVVSLREAWTYVKEKLKELFYIVFNFLKRFSVNDYIRAFEMLKLCRASRRELVSNIIDVMGDKLGRVIYSNLIAF